MQHKLSIKHTTHKHTEKITTTTSRIIIKHEMWLLDQSQRSIQSGTQSVKMHTNIASSCQSGQKSTYTTTTTYQYIKVHT